MNFDFKKFEGRNIRLENRITVTKSYSIGFPSKFFADNKISDYKFVILFWDENSRAIAIKFTNDEKEKSKFSIIRSQAGYGGSVVVRSFFKAYNIDPNKYHGRYDWQKHNIEGVGEVYVIELKERTDIPA
jgi:hypothetical protein